VSIAATTSRSINVTDGGFLKKAHGEERFLQDSPRHFQDGAGWEGPKRGLEAQVCGGASPKQRLRA